MPSLAVKLIGLVQSGHDILEVFVKADSRSRQGFSTSKKGQRELPSLPAPQKPSLPLKKKFPRLTQVISRVFRRSHSGPNYPEQDCFIQPELN